MSPPLSGSQSEQYWGKANSYGRVNMRAAYKATAFRQINKARAQRRAALKALAVAQAAMLAFAPVEAA